MSSSGSEGRIIAAPPPWRLKGTIYSFLMYTSSVNQKHLASSKSFMYSPLEASSGFANGKFLGGLGMVQVIRYTETPVGPYDELVIVPGTFSYRTETAATSKDTISEKKNLRVTRIYVSQKQSCWNGRKNWNIPKHLARFTFTALPGNGMSIVVYPIQDDGSFPKAKPSAKPFFSGIYKPISYLPSFPISTTAAKYIGLDLRLAQPPLPQGAESVEELPGTDRWRGMMPCEFSRKTSLGWWDLKQGNVTEEDSLLASGGDESDWEGYENFWPGIGRRRIGVKMEDAIIEFPEATEWQEPEL